MNYLSFNEASKYLGISRKALDNYAKAGEVAYERIGRGYKIAEDELRRFRDLRNYRTVMLNREDYIKCFEFAVESFYTYAESGSTADFLGMRQRGIGKWAEDFIPGKLGEIAFKKFLLQKFNVEVKLDFSIGKGIPAQDVVEVAKPRRGPLTYNPARIRTSIKTTKMKNIWLAIPQNEYEDPARSSDAYIFVRIDLPLNHLARFSKESGLFGRLGEIIPSFTEIPAEIVGYAWKEDLKYYPEGIKDAAISKPQYALTSGRLRFLEEDWNEYINQL